MSRSTRIIVDADQPMIGLGLQELIQYRDLFITLAYRDLRVRYAQTALGLLWAFVQPAIALLIFSVIFGRAIKVDTGGVPYPVFALAGMIAWNYFSYVLTNSGNSVISAQNMIKKIYFPRLIIPLSKAVAGFVDFGITFLLYTALLLFYRHSPGQEVIWLPAFVLMTIICSLAAGVWVAGLTIRFRDFQHVVPFAVQVGLYATPVVYPAGLIPEQYQLLYYLNPMAGIVEGFRWCLVGGDPINQLSFLSFGMTILIFFSGLFYFRRAERTMADII